jgi:hypothetical protein
MEITKQEWIGEGSNTICDHSRSDDDSDCTWSTGDDNTLTCPVKDKVRSVDNSLDPSRNSWRLRKPDETFLQCVQEHSSQFSIVGGIDALFGTDLSESFLGNFVGGNDITGLVVGLTGSSTSNATEGLATATSIGAEHAAVWGVGKPMTMTGPGGLQRLIPRVGRPARIIGATRGLKALSKTVGFLEGWGEVKLGIDAVLAGALAVACR